MVPFVRSLIGGSISGDGWQRNQFCGYLRLGHTVVEVLEQGGGATVGQSGFLVCFTNTK